MKCIIGYIIDHRSGANGHYILMIYYSCVLIDIVAFALVDIFIIQPVYIKFIRAHEISVCRFLIDFYSHTMSILSAIPLDIQQTMSNYF